VAAELVAPGKGILAADESIATMSARLRSAGVPAAEENRRVYRELLASTPKLSESISGIIFCDETVRQNFADGRAFPDAVRLRPLLEPMRGSYREDACELIPPASCSNRTW
jgi:fructose-bisphosphate aldolase class I